MACAAEVTRGRWIAPGGKVAAAAVRARCIQRRATPHPVWPLLPGARPLSTWLRLTQSDTRVQIDERSAKNVETTLPSALAAVLLTAGFAGSAVAQGTVPACSQPFDPTCNHLKCYAIKDR